VWCIHREFSCESIRERISKIGPHLPKLLTNIKWRTCFFETHSVECLDSEHMLLSRRRRRSGCLHAERTARHSQRNVFMPPSIQCRLAKGSV